MNRLQLTKLRFILRFSADVLLPHFIGNTIRGAFGQALSLACCENKSPLAYMHKRLARFDLKHLFRQLIGRKYDPMPQTLVAAHDHGFIPYLRAIQTLHSSVEAVAVAIIPMSE